MAPRRQRHVVHEVQFTGWPNSGSKWRRSEGQTVPRGRVTMLTVAAFRASAKALARPIPDPPPLTKTTFLPASRSWPASLLASAPTEIRDPRNPSRRSASLGFAGKPPEHRTHRRHSCVAGRQRHRPQDPRPTGEHQLEAAAGLWNNTSTEMSPAPSSRTTPTSISDRHRVRHSVTVTTTSSARIKDHGRTLHLRPPLTTAVTRVIAALGSRLCLSDRAADCLFWLDSSRAPSFARRAARVLAALRAPPQTS